MEEMDNILVGKVVYIDHVENIISGVIEAEGDEFVFSVDLKDDPDNLPLKGLEEGQLVKFNRVEPPIGESSEQAVQSEKVERAWADQIEILVA